MKDLITGEKKNKDIRLNVSIIALVICALGTTRKQKVTLASGYINRSYPSTQGTDGSFASPVRQASQRRRHESHLTGKGLCRKP